jgi:methylthioribose-1-phosphate isomerase
VGVETIKWVGGALRIIDQTKLPTELAYLDCRDVPTVAEAIQSLRVRGAPAIGIAAAYGVLLAALGDVEDPQESVAQAIEQLAKTRPTAVNLFWALQRMRGAATRAVPGSPDELRAVLLAEANAILEEDRTVCRRMGQHGAELLWDGMAVLTHCNAGALATGGIGTALGVIYAACQQGKNVRVFADETRPLLQGSRLTAWELMQNGIDVTVICDSMAAVLMKQGRVDAVIVGADRIAANGDVANKIGTYGLSVLAKAHKLPFYVVAPTSTVDLSIARGEDIPIEERRSEEVTCGFGRCTAPEGVKIFNPAFDVTPNALVTAIISEQGVAGAPYAEKLARWKHWASTTSNKEGI